MNRNIIVQPIQIMAEQYTTRQVIAIEKEYAIYCADHILNKDKFDYMTFEHWLLKREADMTPKPDCRDNGNSGRKGMRKLDRIKSIGKTYFNIKGEQVKITKFLPGVTRFKDDKGRMYSPAGYANIGAMRLPKEYNLIIND